MCTPVNDVLLAAIKKVTDFEKDLRSNESFSSEENESDYLSEDIESNNVNRISLQIGKKISSSISSSMKKS
jgi:hypothetical protein